uniref:TH1 protein, putative n=1 Tax=Theileria annulata TaxID=5874 RepID=A0A3B0MWD6_THEAN
MFDGSKAIEALMSYLTSKYDTDRMRIYMEDKLSHDSWNPPELYWNLMKSPLVVSHMLKIYRDKPKDEFLSSWYQDYMNNFSSYIKMEQSEVNKEGLSRITSNFSVFTLRISEEIHKFLLTNNSSESIELDSLDSISPLFWHAENAYIYSQALLHFIYQWRIDLRGCRRLSQLIAKATTYPNEILRESQLNIDSVLEWSVSQIHLLMTNFSRFPTLHSSFKRLLSSKKSNEDKFNHQELCDFYDELSKTLKAFDSYGFLLFDIRSAPKTEKEHDDSSEEIVVDESVSQFGDKRADEYMRLRNAPEMPPLEAIRESNLLNDLIDDFSNKDSNIKESNSWIKYANLLVMLSVLSPYELLYFHYYEKVSNYIKKLPQREVWQQFYLPPDEYESDDSIGSIERYRDYGAMYDQEYGSSEEHSDASSITASDEYEIKTESHVHKAWQTETSNSILSSNVFSSSSSNKKLSKSRKRNGYMGSDNTEGSKSHDSANRENFKSRSGSSYYNIKRRKASHDYEDALMDDVGSEYMEIKSTLESAIYNNINEQTKLGPGKNISKERLDEMKQLYSQFKLKCDKLMNIARNDLYSLYSIIHNQQDTVEGEYEMRKFIETNIASSVVISYINQRVIKSRNINELSDIKLMLLKEIADKHPVKRGPIILLLRDFCKLCVIGNMDESPNKLERLEAIVDLLVYISRFDRQCITIISVFDSMIDLVDRSISRVFISKMLKFCGPPYSLEFSLMFIKLIEKFIRSGTGGPNVQIEIENTLMRKYINPFVKECLENNYNNQEIIQIAKRCDFKNASE